VAVSSTRQETTVAEIPPPTSDDLALDLAQRYSWLDQSLPDHSPTWAGSTALAVLRRCAAAEAAERFSRRIISDQAAMIRAAEAERDRLREALAVCERSMDTAAQHGLPQSLPPAYRESWAAAHERARAALEETPRG
jgi:hypothetical protein